MNLLEVVLLVVIVAVAAVLLREGVDLARVLSAPAPVQVTKTP